MADGRRDKWLPRSFWIVAGGNVVLFLALILWIKTGSASRYDTLFELFLLLCIGVVCAIVGGVALIRNPAAYGIGLALVAMPPLYYSSLIVKDVVDRAAYPGDKALEAGHGYFTRQADRALADAIVAGDSAKVKTFAAAANLNAIGWNGMTFMRLALENGHADPDVVVALLRAGANPDQDQQMLFGSINDGTGATSGAMITAKNERLLRAAIDAGVDLNHADPQGDPRFITALRWPEGLAIMLDHGADIEAESKNGNTAIMWAVSQWYFPSIDVLLAHGARIDHVNHEGTSLRDLVREKAGRTERDKPPQLTELEARLR